MELNLKTQQNKLISLFRVSLMFFLFFFVQHLERQEHDAELGRMRRRKVLIVNVLRLGFEGGDQRSC